MNELRSTACGIIDRVVAEENQRSDFVRAQVRVSSIGSCSRMVVAQALGKITSTIPWAFSKGGHVLQAMAFHRIRLAYPSAEEEVSVPTSAPRTWTHPDILIPNLGLGIQVKSCKKKQILAYLRGEQTGYGDLPKSMNVDQVLLEWYFWKKAGFCLTETRQRIEGAPWQYELLYIAREDFIDTRCSIPVPWDQERADRLAAEFDRRHEAILWGEIPQKCKTEPDWECGYTPTTYDWDGPHYEEPSVCGMYQECWGKPFVPRTKQDRRR